MYAKVSSAANFGIEGYVVTLEVSIANGLPRFKIVGLPDKAVEEAKDRVTAAIKAAGFTFPLKRITVNLRPSNVPKHGTGFDLPMAIGILVATGQVEANLRLGECAFIGELGLDGTVRQIQGLPILVQTLQDNKAKKILLPNQDTYDTNRGGKIQIFKFVDLKSVTHFLADPTSKECALNDTKPTSPSVPEIRFFEIAGNDLAKRALAISAAGGHHVALTGPPGCGKTTLAQAMIELLPSLNTIEAAEVQKIYSITSENPPLGPPFRSPHHTASSTAILGGGSNPVPGEISLAHNGILFMDEFPEFSRAVLTGLRQPLEAGSVTISRKNGRVKFPARFTLIAAMNPCPCGFYGHPTRPCTCKPHEIASYSSRVSHAIWDRIDLFVPVFSTPIGQISNLATRKNTIVKIQKSIARALSLQHFRGCRNNAIQLRDLKLCNVIAKAQRLLCEAYTKLELSTRGYLKTLRVARTIADLEGSDRVTEDHITEALGLRKREN